MPTLSYSLSIGHGATHLTGIEVGFEMKISLSAEELDELSGLDDAALAKVVKDALKEFRGKRSGTEGEDNELEPGAQTTRGATGGPREGARLSQDSAVRAAQDSALKRHEENVRQAERDREAAQFIKGYDRL